MAQLEGTALYDDARRRRELPVAGTVLARLTDVVVEGAVDLQDEHTPVGQEPLGVGVATATTTVATSAL
jgi:hypothetical protein